MNAMLEPRDLSALTPLPYIKEENVSIGTARSLSRYPLSLFKAENYRL
jgi:hypothetical protein